MPDDAEMYLIVAEAFADGAAGDANWTLSELVKTKDPAFVSPGAGGILAEILLQSRIALWAEGFR